MEVDEARRLLDLWHRGYPDVSTYGRSLAERLAQRQVDPIHKWVEQPHYLTHRALPYT